MEESLPLKDILLDLGFNVISEGLLSYRGDGMSITGHIVYFPPAIHILGRHHTERESGIIQFMLPLNVDSYQEGFKILVRQFRSLPRSIWPQWLRNKILRQEEERKQWLIRYQAAPKAVVERQEFRNLYKKILLQKSTLPASQEIAFHFDGYAFKIKAGQFHYAMTAVGDPWPGWYSAVIGDMPSLPAKFLSPEIKLLVMDDHFSFYEEKFKVSVLKIPGN